MPFFTEDTKQGVKSFTDLNDTPAGIVAGQAVRGNASGTALEFYVPASGGGGGAAIDDSSISTSTTYSSSKIVSELSSKASTASVNTKLSLTGGSLTGDVTTSVPNGSFSSTSLVSKNYVDNAVGGSSGATTYTALTDTPSTHAANALLYSTGSAIAHTTTQIAIDGNGVEVNQLNARQNNVSNIGDSTHKFNDVFCTNIHQGNVKLVVPSVRGTTGQYVKVSNATNETHTLEFADVINDGAASSTTTYSSTKIDQELNDKTDKSSIQTTAEGNSTSETDVYSCNSVFSKDEVGNSLQTKTLKVHGTSGAGYLNLGSDQSSGVYLLQQTYQGTNRTSMQTWATSGTSDTNVSWWFNRLNSLRELIRIRPQDSAKFQILDGGGIHAEGYMTTDQTSFTANNQLVTKQYADTQDATKLSLTGGSMTGHISTNQVSFSNTQLVTRSYTDTKVAALIDDSIYRNYLVWSSTKTRDTINGLIDDTTYRTTNVWSSTKTRNEIISAAAAKLDLTGGAMTGHITTNQSTFSANNQLVTKQYVDAQIVAGGGASQFTQLTDTPSSYTANRFLKSTGSALDWFELNSKTLTWDFYNALSDLPSASSNHGMLAHVHAEAAIYYAHNGAWVKLANDSRVNSSVANITLSGADLSVTRQDGTAFLVSGVNPPALSWAVTAGTVSSDGSSLQLTQTNNGSAPNITGLTPNTVADTCYVSSTVASNGLQFTKKDSTTVTHANVLVPPISSGTNQYILSNDGSSASWLSSIQGSSTTLNFGTTTLKKFVTWATGTFNEYFMKATPSNGDQLGTIIFGDTALNQYTTIGGRVGDTTSGAQYGYNLIQAARGGTMVDIMRVGKIGASDAHDVYVNGSTGVHELKFVNPATGAVKGTSQAYPVEAPATAGHVLTAGAGGTWSWAAASGGGGSSIPTSRQLNVSTANSGNSYQITAADGTTTYSGIGHLYGVRYYDWLLEETLLTPSQLMTRFAENNYTSGARNIAPMFQWLNGIIGASSNSESDRNPYGYCTPYGGAITVNENSHLGGHILLYRPGFAYNFTKLYWSDSGTHYGGYTMSNQDSAWNASNESRWALFASTDKTNWATLCCWSSSGSTGWSYNGVSSIARTVSATHPYGLASGQYTTGARTNTISFTNSNYYQYWMIKNIDAIGSAKEIMTGTGISPIPMLRIGNIAEIMFG